MSFEKNYRVLEEIPQPLDGQDQEVLAREIATSRPAVIHLLRESPGAEHNAYLRRILSLGPDKNHVVLESGTFRGRPYIVTKILPDNVSLREWSGEAAASSAPVSRVAPPPAVPAPPPPSAPVPPPETVGRSEFSMMFRPAASRVADRPPEPVDPPAPAEPSEFSQLFRPRIARPAPAPEAAPAAAPSEFSQIFKNSPVSAEPAAPAPPGPPPAARPPSEFSQIFRTAPAPAARSAGEGEFTANFSSKVPHAAPERPAAAPPASSIESLLSSSPPAGSRSEASQLFSTKPTAAAPTVHAPAGPVVSDEFEGNFGPAANAPLKVAPAVPETPKPEPVSKLIGPWLPLIGGVAALLAIAILLVLFFAWRPGS